jgi:hypothetical protein
VNIDTDIMIAEIDEALDKIRKKELEEKDKEIERLNNIINELEKELDNLIIFNQSNITCNHYTPDDWKDSKLIDNMLYKMKPISFLAQELKDKLKALKEGK